MTAPPETELPAETSAETHADPGDAGGGPIVEWFRIDHGDEQKRVLVLGSALVLAGVFAVGAGIAPSLLVGPGRTAVVLLGLVLVAAGPGVVFLWLRRTLGRDGYLALTTEGLVVELHGARRYWPWADVDDVVPRGEHGFTVRSPRGDFTVNDPIRGHSAAALARRILDAKRKALFGLYRPRA